MTVRAVQTEPDRISLMAGSRTLAYLTFQEAEALAGQLTLLAVKAPALSPEQEEKE